MRYRARTRGPNGEQRTKTFSTKRAAEAWERERLGARDKGLWADPGSGRTTVADWRDRWLETVSAGVTRGTLQQYRWQTNNAVAVLGTRQMANVTPLDIQRLVAAWSKTLKPSTVHTRYVGLAMMFSAAVDAEVIGRTPCRNVKLPRNETSARKMPTLDELDTLVAALPERMRALVWIAAHTGLRWGEVSALRVGDVDVLRKTLSVRRSVVKTSVGRIEVQLPKTAKSTRTLAISDDLAGIIAAHMRLKGLTAADREAWLFATSGGQPQRYSHFYTWWREARVTAQVPQLGFHDLRRLHATVLVAAGVDVRTAQERLGHTNPSTTLRHYAQAVEQLDRAAADVASLALWRPSKPAKATE